MREIVSATNNLTAAAVAGMADGVQVTFDLDYVTHETGQVTVTAGELRAMLADAGADPDDALFEVDVVRDYLLNAFGSVGTDEHGGLELA